MATRRNAARVAIDRQFIAADARVKLKHLYPVVKEQNLAQLGTRMTRGLLTIGIPSAYTPAQPHSASLRVAVPGPPGTVLRPVGARRCSRRRASRGCGGKPPRLPCLERRGGADPNEAGATRRAPV
mgnify:CR=1 FL=1